MSKKNILIVSLILIGVIIIGLLGGMLLSGKLEDFKSHFNSKQDTVADDTQIESNHNEDKEQMPSAPISIIIDDIEIISQDSYKQISESGFNTLIYRTDKDNYRMVTEIIDSSDNHFYDGIIADVSDNYTYIADMLSNTAINFIILSGTDETVATYSDYIKECVSFIRDKDPLVKIGIQPMFISKMDKNIENLIELSYFDFIFLSESNIASESMKTAQDIWCNAESDLWLCFNLIGLSEIDGSKAESIINSINSCKNVQNCKALAFNNFSSISGAEGVVAENVIEFIKNTESNILDRKFSVTNYSSKEITVNESTVTFKGTSNPLFELKCNDKVMNVADNGDFSVDCHLNAGKNNIVFEHRGEKYSYSVTYLVKILKNVDPISSVTVPGLMKIEVKAVALKKSNVKVAFNGKTYDMARLENDDEERSDSGSDFATFYAMLDTVKETESIQNLGAYKVTATYSGLKETLTGATVYVKAKYVPKETTTATTEQITETSTSEVQTETTTATQNGSTSKKSYRDMTASVKYTRATTTAKAGTTNSKGTTLSPSNGVLQKYSYKKNYGLGNATICEIIDDYVETFPGNSTSTYSLPNYSPLLKGTVDYVEGSAEFDNSTYYILSSGIKVPVSRKENSYSGRDTKYTHVNISDGFVMPLNSMHVLSCTSYNGETIIKIDMNRKVPFNVKLLGQTYSNYNGRSVKVSTPNFTGLEFTFSDSDRIYGQSLSFMNSVVRSGKYYTDNNCVKLSLNFDTSGKFYGFHYEYDNEGFLVITIRNKPELLSDYVIMLDAGHGGYDPGAVCCVTSNSYASEKKINLSLALKVKELLEAEGAKVIMTRSDDRFLGLTDRTDLIRSRNPDIFISFHCDSSSSSSAWGTTAYYYRAYSQPLAKYIHQSIVSSYKNKIYYDNKAYADGVDRGTDFYAYKVIRVEECPSVLIEYGFLSNTEECQKLQNASCRNILAQATVDGIKNYFANS